LLVLSHLKSEWPQKYLKALYPNTGSIFQPFCNFSQTALGLLTTVSDKRLKSRKGLLKIDICFVLNCHPDLPW
jgi:hypothetical protein